MRPNKFLKIPLTPKKKKSKKLQEKIQLFKKTVVKTWRKLKSGVVLGDW